MAFGLAFGQVEGVAERSDQLGQLERAGGGNLRQCLGKSIHGKNFFVEIIHSTRHACRARFPALNVKFPGRIVQCYLQNAHIVVIDQTSLLFCRLSAALASCRQAGAAQKYTCL